MQVRKLQTRFDADAPGAGTDVPKRFDVVQREGGQRTQAHRHLGYHLLTPVKKGEVALWQAERPVPGRDLFHQHTVGLLHSHAFAVFPDAFPVIVAHVFAHVQAVVGVAVVHHAFPDSLRRFRAVGQATYEPLSPYQCLVKPVPAASGQRHGAHILIWFVQTMG